MMERGWRQDDGKRKGRKKRRRRERKIIDRSAQEQFIKAGTLVNYWR